MIVHRNSVIINSPSLVDLTHLSMDWSITISLSHQRRARVDVKSFSELQFEICVPQKKVSPLSLYPIKKVLSHNSVAADL